MILRSIKYRRLCAIFLDLLIISLFTSLLFSNYITNPYYNDYLVNSEEYQKNITEVDLKSYNTTEKMNEFINNTSELLYKTSKSQIFYYIWYIVLCFLYFVLFQYSTGGHTLGNKLYRLKLVNSESNKKISLFRLFGRTLFTGEIILFDGIVLISVLNIIGLLVINSAITYFYYYALINFIGIVFEIIVLIMFFNNKKNETVSDKIFKTKVIEVK